MNINRVNIGDYWVSFDIENTKATDRNGKRSEEVEATMTFIKGGLRVAKVHKLGNFDLCAKLADGEFARNYASKYIERSKVSASSPFK